MEPIYLLLVAALLVWFAVRMFSREASNRASSDESIKAAPSYHDDSDDEDDWYDASFADRTSTAWEARLPRPPGQWRIWGARTEVQGTHVRREAIIDFIAKATSAKARGVYLELRLKREPSNPFDRNAIAIFAHLEGSEMQFGYVDRETAAELAARTPPDMPLAAVLNRVRMNSFNLYLQYDLLIPAKRASFWKGRDFPL